MKALLFFAALLLASSPVAATPSAGSAGSADLALSLSMIVAGDGPQAFKMSVLIRALDLTRGGVEIKRLQRRFGLGEVHSFLSVSDYVVADALDILQLKQIDFPDEPSPPPQDTRRLIEALYRAGAAPGGYDPRVMLDTLVSPPIHAEIARDVDAKFGLVAERNYYLVLIGLMGDLRAAAAAAGRAR
jgi:hypothetical protein